MAANDSNNRTHQLSLLADGYFERDIKEGMRN